MKKISNKLFNHKNDTKETDIETVYIDSVEELDQCLTDMTLQQMAADQSGSKPPPKKKIVLNKKIWEMGADNLFEIMMMKMMDRVMNDKRINNIKPKYIEGDIETGKRIISLFKDENETVH
jgi:hypothetical protein